MQNITRNDVLVKTNGIGALYERPKTTRFDDVREAIELSDGQLLAMEYKSMSHGMLWATFTIGSVISYALRNGDDPIRALDRARDFGHDLVWINGNGACISNYQIAPKHHVIVTLNDLVRFEGKVYKIVPASNHNLALLPMKEEVAA